MLNEKILVVILHGDLSLSGALQCRRGVGGGGYLGLRRHNHLVFRDCERTKYYKPQPLDFTERFLLSRHCLLSELSAQPVSKRTAKSFSASPQEVWLSTV